jgi:hypothetical protein
MKPEHDTVPNAPPPDATDPGEARLRPSERPTDPPPGRRRADDATIPDPVDVERLILSLERKPSPPAPMPEERPSSDGGRFVAYRGSNRPAPPRSPEETRRKALAELSVMVNATPVPSETDGRNASTGRLHRRKGTVIRAQVIWAVAAVVLTLAAVLSVIAVTTRQPSTSFVLSPPTALVVAPTGATLAQTAPSRVLLPPLETSAPLAAPAPPAPEPRGPERASPPSPARAPAPPTAAPRPPSSPLPPAVAIVAPLQAPPRLSAAALPAPATNSSSAPAPSRSTAKSAFDRW